MEAELPIPTLSGQEKFFEKNYKNAFSSSSGRESYIHISILSLLWHF